MLLTTTNAEINPGDQQFTLLVPGHQIWSPRSVYAVATRAVGGAPDRSYLLTITNGTNTVANVGAVDDGAEPGTCTVTWTLCPAAHVASGADGVTVAPLAPMTLPGGYVILGSIIAPAVGDEWTRALVWYDYVMSTPPGIL